MNMRNGSFSAFLRSVWGVIVTLLLVGCVPTAVPATSTPAPTSTPTAALVPVPTLQDDQVAPVLRWHREGGIAGLCDDLSVFADGRVVAASCCGAESVEVGRAVLDAERHELLRGWLDTLAAFEVTQTDPATADAMTIRLSFVGDGRSEAIPADQEALQAFAAETFAAYAELSSVTPEGQGVRCAEAFDHRELRQPYQPRDGQPRYTLSAEELDAYLAVMGLESLCIPEELGAPFLNVDWDSAASSTVTGRMISLGFEDTYTGAGWSDGYLLYATYDFAAGSEYDTFAALEDRDALRGGTMPGALEVNGVPGFVRFQPSLCYGACWMYRTVVFPFETSYVAVVYKVGAYNVEADWSALEQALQDGAYPPERRRTVATMDWLAQSLRFR